MEPFLRFRGLFFTRYVISTETQCSEEIYLDRFSYAGQSWFSTPLHPIAIGSARNDDIEVVPIEINTALKLLKQPKPKADLYF